MIRGPQIVMSLIALVFVLIFMVIMFNLIMNFLHHGDFGSLVASVVFLLFFGLPVLMFFCNIVRIIKKGGRETERSALAAGMRHTDFMTNRTVVRTTSVRVADSDSTPAPAAVLQSRVINGVEWRWPDGKPKARDLQAFCSKCGKALVAVNDAESWQADLHCNSCGKSYVSIPGQGPDAGKRTFDQTKKLAAKMLATKGVRL